MLLLGQRAVGKNAATHIILKNYRIYILLSNWRYLKIKFLSIGEYIDVTSVYYFYIYIVSYMYLEETLHINNPSIATHDIAEKKKSL